MIKANFLDEFSKYRKIVLSNGLKVILLKRKNLPFINFSLIMNIGAVADPPTSQGISSLVFELLFKGTKNRSSYQIAREIDSLGGILTSSTNLDYSGIFGEFLNQDIKKAFEILSDIILNPIFPSRELLKVRNKRIEKLKEEIDDPPYLATKEFFRNLFFPHPYGYSIKGRINDLMKLKERDIKSHYFKFSTPHGSILSIVGDFKEEELMKIVEGAFEKWEGIKKNSDEILPPHSVKERKIYLLDRPELTQSQIRLGNLGFPRGHEDYFPALIANTILGGSFTSRLVREIRIKRGLTYHINSSFISFKKGGAFYVSTFGNNNSTYEIISLSLNEMKKMKEKECNKKEIERAKKYIQGIFPLKFETNESISLLLAELEFYKLKLDFITDFYSKLKKVEIKDIKRISNKYFETENFCLFVLGKKKNIIRDLEKLGEVKIVNLNL